MKCSNNLLPKYISPNKLSELSTYFYALDLLCERYFKNKEGDIDWKVYNGWEFDNENGECIKIKYSWENAICPDQPCWESDVLVVSFVELTQFWLNCVDAYEEANNILDKQIKDHV